MAIALVGTIGAVTTGSSGAAITPAWGASENRSFGNLLVAWVTAQTTSGSATLPATPSGWTLAKSASATAQASSAIYYKIAAGSDAAPTFALVASTVLQGRLAEYSGAYTSTTAFVLDQTGNGTAVNTSPLASTNAASDYQSADLIVSSYAITYSAAATKTLTLTNNNGATATVVNSAGTSTVNHFAFAYGTTTANNGGDNASLTFTTTNSVGVAACTASFKVITTSLVRQFPWVSNSTVGVLGSTTVSSYTITGNVLTAGDLLLVHHTAFDQASTGNTVSGVSDNFANPYSWSKLQGAIAGTTGGEVWVGKPPTSGTIPSGAVTITVTMTGNIFAPIGALHEITGNFNKVNQIRTSALASGSSTTATASYTPTSSGDLVLLFACQGANPYTAWPAVGQGASTDLISGTSVYGGALWKSGTNGTAFSGSWTCVSSQWYVITVVVAYSYTTGSHPSSWTPIQRAAFW